MILSSKKLAFYTFNVLYFNHHAPLSKGTTALHFLGGGAPPSVFKLILSLLANAVRRVSMYFTMMKASCLRSEEEEEDF
jgi:hypothetical protein